MSPVGAALPPIGSMLTPMASDSEKSNANATTRSGARNGLNTPMLAALESIML